MCTLNILYLNPEGVRTNKNIIKFMKGIHEPVTPNLDYNIMTTRIYENTHISELGWFHETVA